MVIFFILQNILANLGLTKDNEGSGCSKNNFIDLKLFRKYRSVDCSCQSTNILFSCEHSGVKFVLVIYFLSVKYFSSSVLENIRV
jgi:hypothetical protein